MKEGTSHTEPELPKHPSTMDIRRAFASLFTKSKQNGLLSKYLA